MRNKEMITTDIKDVLMCKQILRKSNVTNMWKTVRRSCMLILGLNKGLNNIMTKIIRDNKNKMLIVNS